ncbi:ubiquitin carboxyl-terminal hydrolase 22 [Caerostris extrusa]|uniref:Ubiquitin carboxyl-terminal hydrolase 22 n=1 Tax=Caerostris extrusa TaxID=172846 RepID=A0AAV4WEK7_CAEEX|nr:ubiquitin carboxyl-terminal hydrolase 22 [Caerostris extrusa]
MSFCEHLNKCKKRELSNYRVITCYFVFCSSDGARKLKASVAHCQECRDAGYKGYKRVNACMSCVYFGCVDEGHMQEHAFVNKHNLYVDLRNSNIYCYACDDYAYDKDCARIARLYKKKSQLEAAGLLEYCIPKSIEVEIEIPKSIEVEIEIPKENNGEEKIPDDTSMGNLAFILDDLTFKDPEPDSTTAESIDDPHLSPSCSSRFT